MSMIINTIFWFSLACILASGSVWLYYFGYNRGYSHGHHSGLSLGMFKAYESINKKKIKEETKREEIKWMNQKKLKKKWLILNIRL